MILLDTHVVLWLAFEPERLSKRAQHAIRTAHDDLHLAAILAAVVFLANIGLQFCPTGFTPCYQRQKL